MEIPLRRGSRLDAVATDVEEVITGACGDPWRFVSGIWSLWRPVQNPTARSESNTTISLWDLGILAAVCLDLGIRFLIPLLLISSSEPHSEQQTTFGDSLQHLLFGSNKHLILTVTSTLIGSAGCCPPPPCGESVRRRGGNEDGFRRQRRGAT
jgi:hypothetical protein